MKLITQMISSTNDSTGNIIKYYTANNTIQVTHAYRIGKSINKSEPQSIIACLETDKQKYAAVKKSFRLKHSIQFQNAY